MHWQPLAAAMLKSAVRLIPVLSIRLRRRDVVQSLAANAETANLTQLSLHCTPDDSSAVDKGADLEAMERTKFCLIMPDAYLATAQLSDAVLTGEA